MSKRSPISKNRLTGGMMLAAAGAAAAALGGAGTASATCASISGIGNGNGCTSTPTSFAIGIGDKTEATATGLFTGAIAVGNNNGAADLTQAKSDGAFSLAMALGKNTWAVTHGNLGLAVAQGTGATAALPVYAQAGLDSGDNLNVALNLASTATAGLQSEVLAAGQGNVAANIGGSPSATRPTAVYALGTGNAAFNLGGKGNLVLVGLNNPGTLNLGFQAGGNDNTVTTEGLLAIAGSLGKSNQNGANQVAQVGPGININNM